MPIKSILMVTHNIEEAVLMCDRMLIFSSNPGRVVPRSGSICSTRATVSIPHSANSSTDLCPHDQARAGRERTAR